MTTLLHRLSNAALPKAFRLLVLFWIYAGILFASLWISYQLRFEFAFSPGTAAEFVRGAEWMVPASLAALWAAGQFRSLLSYFSVPDLWRILAGEALITAGSFALWIASDGRLAPPRSVLLINLMVAASGLVLFRLSLRLVRERYRQWQDQNPARIRRVAVLGATDGGALLIRGMKTQQTRGMHPVAIFDDNPRRWGRQIHGVPIIGPLSMLSSTKNAVNVAEVIIAQPGLSKEKLQEIVHDLAQVGVKCTRSPLMSGSLFDGASPAATRELEIEDLLGRDPVDLRTEDIRHALQARRVAVTGAGGSIGRELCRQISGYGPSLLVMIEQCEAQLYTAEQEIHHHAPGLTLAPCVADILDEARIDQIFRRHRPEIVFHAAAHKHVPLMEHQPAEAFQNNVIATARLAAAAQNHRCTHFVMISTDKAVNPTSVMGATKRLAEMCLQARHAGSEGGTRFMAVRFGNVLGSSGSVVPTFRQQIARGGPITVTHPDVKRYFMTTGEAVGLVLQCAVQGAGGEIFVLDMGTPVKIADLARQMIELSGLRPGIDIRIEFTGLRPGEKLFEEINLTTENHRPTTHAKIMRFIARPQSLPDLADRLRQLHGECHRMPAPEVKRRLREFVPEYQPYLGAPELVTDSEEVAVPSEVD